MAAGSNVAMACSTAFSCRQSYSWQCAWKPLRKAAAGAGTRLRRPHTQASAPSPQLVVILQSSSAPAAAEPAIPTPIVSRMNVLAWRIASAERSSQRVASAWRANLSDASMWFMRSPKGYGPDPRISLTLNPGYDSAIPDERGRQMGVLIDGQWRDEELPQERGQGGDFRRADSRFRDRITAAGSS